MKQSIDTSARHPEAVRYLEEESKQALLNRLSRLKGHLGAVERMLEEERCADEILLQVAAVKAALNRFSALLLEDELRSCMATCMQADPTERLGRAVRALSTLLKQS